MPEKAKRGRPALADSERKRNNVTIRMRDSMRAALAETAKADGRSLSEEIEFRLERSFADDAAFATPEMRHWAHYMAGIFHGHGSYEATIRDHPDREKWMGDPICYEVAMFAVIRTLFMQHPAPTPENVALQINGLQSMLLSFVEQKKKGERA